MSVPFVDLKKQYHAIKPEIQEAVSRVLDSGDFILGRETERFERLFAQFCRAKHAVSVSNGTTALHCALAACDIGPGDEVILPSHTFMATYAAVRYVGATAVLVDVDPVTYTMDTNQISDAITKDTKAIMPVHLYGQAANMKLIKEIADRNDLRIIEDCAQAVGATHTEKVVPYADIGTFSFYPTKNLGAYGEGGAVVSNDPHIAQRVRELRNHGQTEKNVHSTIGYNYRLCELQSAILQVKLAHLPDWIEKRRKLASLHTKNLQDLPLKLPVEVEDNKHVYHLYVVQTDQREAFMQYLGNKGIGTAIHYPTPIHQQPAFNPTGKDQCFSLTNTEQLCPQIVSLPFYPEMEPQDMHEVWTHITNFFNS